MSAPTAERITYAEAHQVYRAAGWLGPLPLPEGAKWPPPEDWTGWNGAYPSYADSVTWAEEAPVPRADGRIGHDYRGTRQLALRMADDVIGIDVDHYGEKRGGDTLAEAERRWGALPAAPRSSARGAESPSGIRFYRVPKGTTLRTEIKFPELKLGGIEIIQRHHRYAVVWPSTNPHADNAPYQWIDTAGPDRPPRADMLNELPAAWLEALSTTSGPGLNEATTEQVHGFVLSHVDSNRPGYLKGAVEVFTRAVAAGSSRHDAMLNAACMAAREVVAGYYPARDAAQALSDAYVRALSESNKPGARLELPDVARREFLNTWSWAVGQVLELSPAEARSLTAAGAAEDAPARSASGIRSVAPTYALEQGAGSTVSAWVGEPRTSGIKSVGGALRGEDDTTYPPALPPAGPGDSIAATMGFSEDEEAELAEKMYRAAVSSKVREQDITEDARRFRNARDAPPLEVLDWDAFLDAEQPDYLVPGMLYRDSTAKVYGAPGSTKSYLLLDLALHLATGRAWFGVEMPRTRVHYVMAEGQAVNVARTLGWLAAHGVDRGEARGWFDVIPQGVMLTEQGVATYLERVQADAPGLVILDTKNAMMEGDENSASDVAVMVRAMRSIRDASNACVVLVDHTGMSDTTRGRGSNAVTAAMDTELRVERDADSGVIRAEVTRDKAAEPGARWTYQLARFDGHVPGLRPGSKAPAYVVPIDENAPAARAIRSAWYDADQPALPDALVRCTEAGVDAARDAFRVLRFLSDPDGVSRAQIVAGLTEGKRSYPPTTLGRGLGLLVDLGLVDKPTRGSYSVAMAYMVKR